MKMKMNENEKQFFLNFGLFNGLIYFMVRCKKKKKLFHLILTQFQKKTAVEQFLYNPEYLCEKQKLFHYHSL